MRTLVQHGVDWVSVKLNLVCFVGLLAQSQVLNTFTILATLTTITYNLIKIYKELKNKKRKS